MKKFLVTVLAILTVISMSACTKTAQHELLDVDGNLKGFVVETLETLNEYCTKLEFLDENKNVVYTAQTEGEGLYYRWSINDNPDYYWDTPLQLVRANSDDASLRGVVSYEIWDSINKGSTGKVYYTFSYSGKIMEVHQMTEDTHDEAWYYTESQYYNEDGSVKWSYSAKYGDYFLIAFSVLNGERCISIREYDKSGKDAGISYYYEDTLGFIESQSWEYSDESTLAPKYTYYYNADGSLWYKDENVFDDEGYITDVIYYDANGNPIDEIPQ